MIDYLATRRPGDGSYVARVTPYALVAAELLGANVQVLGTYVSQATGRTTYQSYFVVARNRFSQPPELPDLVRMLRGAKPTMLDMALQAFGEAVELDPQLVQAWIMIIRIQSALGDNRAALKTADRALEVNPDSVELNLIRADLL